ncbi:general transcription factor IIH subunit 4 [Phlebotomus argentipes]|uniref:general transcription factor IIH subunit 4 n=1 Tax=Phlebotomus argentipes TaxID=94469 RepID=UPI0028933B54|nr:general transcription factor IIH subunit 4 [Phlebotomus argentipes]
MPDPKASKASIGLPKASNLECKDLYEYLQTRSPEVLEKLYNYATICLAVYRELPEIGRQFVIRILFVEQPVPQAVVSSWGSQLHAKEHTSAIGILSDLGVWRAAAIPGGLPAWELCPTYKKNLKIALLGGGKPWSMSNSLESDSKARDVAFLDNYAMSRWRCVLHYMVGACNTKAPDGEAISPDAVRILLHANLMKREDDGSCVITKQGFQFLLLDTQAQVWHFMLQYLDTCHQRGLDLGECLSMLFQLSFSTLGRDYSSEGLSPGMLTFLQHLREFGLVYQRKRKAGRFYPTRLALNITNKDAVPIVATEEDAQASPGKRHIVIETNYRVYAYTDSNLLVALLGLFTELLYRFPNLTVGVLTRDSVRSALRGGITAEQIISYLEQHAHSAMLSAANANVGYRHRSCLPPTIVDQIKLWENERNRFVYTEGVVYNQFLSQADFITLRDYAQSISVLVWQNERTRTMVVTKSGHDDVKKFWKRYSKGTT